MKASGRDQQRVGGGAAGSDVPEPAKPAALVGILAAAAVFVYLLRNALLPFVLAGIIAYVLTPLITWLGKKTSLPRGLFAVLA